jgi:DNA invertase Pin-like site-specific DNA recombinase
MHRKGFLHIRGFGLSLLGYSGASFGVSWLRRKRPELECMLAACRRCQAEAVMLYRCNRFTRSLRPLANALCAFEALGIQFLSLHEGVDTSTPKGRLVLGIFASIAEFERELLRGRVRSGLAVARARSKRLGPPPSGVDAQKFAALPAQGLSWREIADRLGVGIGTVHRAARERLKDHSLAVPAGS